MTSISAQAGPRPQVGSKAVIAGIATLAAVHVLTAVSMAAAPGAFFETVGPFGTYNAHYIRDMASMIGGVGVALLVSLRWAALRTGVLVAAAGSNGLHSVNHWVDIGNAHPGSPMGVIDAVSQTMLFGACLVVLFLLLRTDRA